MCKRELFLDRIPPTDQYGHMVETVRATTAKKTARGPAAPSDAVDRRTEILTKARDIFARYGFRKTTVEEIAAACNLGKAALYYYFQSKEEIFAAVVRREADQLFEGIAAAVGAVSAPREKLLVAVKERRALVRQKFRELAIPSDVLREMIPLAEEERKRIMRRDFEFMKKILLEGQRKGVFKPFNVDVVARTFVAGLTGSERYYIETDQADLLDDGIDELFRLLCDGMCK
jgi:AcrR family transcriptional regulator